MQVPAVSGKSASKPLEASCMFRLGTSKRGMATVSPMYYHFRISHQKSHVGVPELPLVRSPAFELLAQCLTDPAHHGRVPRHGHGEQGGPHRTSASSLREVCLETASGILHVQAGTFKRGTATVSPRYYHSRMSPQKSLVGVPELPLVRALVLELLAQCLADPAHHGGVPRHGPGEQGGPHRARASNLRKVCLETASDLLHVQAGDVQAREGYGVPDVLPLPHVPPKVARGSS